MWHSKSGHLSKYAGRLPLLLLLLQAFVAICKLPAQTRLRVVELNCENLFYPEHHEGKNDLAYTPDGEYRWGYKRYYTKLNNVGRTLLAAGDDLPPDLVGLCEVEDDSTLVHLTRRSLLKNIGYRYVMTASPDARGINVALLYQPMSFHLLNVRTITVEALRASHPTRDVLHVTGSVLSGDTLDVLVAHLPSKRGGATASEPYRMAVAQLLSGVMDTIRRTRQTPNILLMGDMNEDSSAEALQYLQQQVDGVEEQVVQAIGQSRGTYKYQGEWSQIDHIFTYMQGNALRVVPNSYVIADYPFLLEPDTKFGGSKPYRTFYGRKCRNAFSDHLPLRLDLEVGKGFSL